MPAGKGKKLLRCSIPETVYDDLVREATVQGVDLGAMVEGYLVQARHRQRGYLSLIERRLDRLTEQQEAILGLFETFVRGLDGRKADGPNHEADAVPIATYQQMYQVPASVTNQAPSQTNERPRKRGWWG
jgi:hypothetical protein